MQSMASPAKKRPISDNCMTVAGPDATDQVVRLRDVAPRASDAELLLRVEVSAVCYVGLQSFVLLGTRGGSDACFGAEWIEAAEVVGMASRSEQMPNRRGGEDLYHRRS